MKMSHQFMQKASKMLMTTVLTLSFQACGDHAENISEVSRANNGGGAAGGKCEVTSGPNKGKTGTYDGTGWCTGDWGGTECTALDGSSKCKDIPKVVKPVILKPIIVKPIVGMKN